MVDIALIRKRPIAIVWEKIPGIIVGASCVALIVTNRIESVGHVAKLTVNNGNGFCRFTVAVVFCG